VHNGASKGFNFASVTTEEVFVDFILPRAKDLFRIYGKKQRDNKATEYKKLFD
jgi:hypothetical protein